MDKGWFEHPVFDDQPFTEREAWAWMIAAAAPAERFRRLGQVRVLVKRGQFKHSHRFLAKRWQWSVARVQRFLAKLVAESMIESVTESGVTCVTLCNYDKYQPSTAVTESAASQQPSQIKEESKPTNTESNIGGGGDSARAPARDSIISDQAFALANEVMRTLDIDPKFIPPGWCGAAMWLQAGLSSGWNPELVRIAAARLRARRNFRQPYTYRYLLQPIVREHELASEPSLPVPPMSVSRPEVPDAQAPADWRSRRDAQHAAFAEFREANRELGQSQDGDGTVVRMVPNARRA